MAASKADRLAILKTVRANLSPLFGLYRDEAGRHPRGAGSGLRRRAGGRDRLRRRRPPAALADRRPGADRRAAGPGAGPAIFIADGHHRYESMLHYRRWLAEQRGALPAWRRPPVHPHVPLPLQRSRAGHLPDPPAGLRAGGAQAGRRSWPGWSATSPSSWWTRACARRWGAPGPSPASREHAGKTTAFLMVIGRGRAGPHPHAARRRRPLRRRACRPTGRCGTSTSPCSTRWCCQHLLGVSAQAQDQGESLTYVRDAGEAVNRVLSGEHQFGFLLNPTPMWQVEAVGDAGADHAAEEHALRPAPAERPGDAGHRLRASARRPGARPAGPAGPLAPFPPPRLG